MQTWHSLPLACSHLLPGGQMEGVEGYFDHTHVPGDNMMGPIVHDEEVFASSKVTCVGQVSRCP